MTVDLSPEAVERRVASQKRGKGHAGSTGRQLIVAAGGVFDRANQLLKVSQKRPPGPRRNAAAQKAVQAMLTCSVQLRIAERTPLDKGYLHHLTVQQIQACEAEVHRLAAQDFAALAADAQRRLNDQRLRARTEGAS